MTLSLPIALDAMGGDFAPKAVIEGAFLALKNDPNLRFLIVGDEAQIEPHLRWRKKLREVSEVIHTPHAIAAHEKPSVALRQGRDSSMRLTLNAVKEGKACAAISAGNTGALMAKAKFVFKTLPGITRPAIAAVFPAIGKNIVMLDLGANISCSGEDLFQFALMGDAFAKVVLQIDHPKVAILNVGSEDQKGHEEVRVAAQMLRAEGVPLNFCGYVEGNDIVEGNVDVVVTDGFTGNIALKTAEGTGRLIRQMIKDSLQSSVFAKLGFLLARPALATLKKRLDPRSYNGAMFIGLNGIAIKSHGSADYKGIANAIRVTKELVLNDINAKIIQELQRGGISALATTKSEAVELVSA